MPEKPATGTREWAEHRCNVDIGCPNRCDYCYAQAMAIQYGRATAASWACPRPNKSKVPTRKLSGRVMMPTTHDIHPGNLERCLAALRTMLAAGNEVLIVSKPRMEAITVLCRELAQYRDRLTFRFTIGARSNLTLRAWEPDAPSYMERKWCLSLAHGLGFKVGVSCEPMLETTVEGMLGLVDALAPHVTDELWIGRANMLKARVSMNRPGDAIAMYHAQTLEAAWPDEKVMELYRALKDNPVVRWKDSIRKVVEKHQEGNA